MSNCKDCITYAICRNELINLLGKWDNYNSDCKNYNYLDVYICITRGLETKCKIIKENYLKHNKEIEIRDFVNYSLKQLSLGDVIKIEM